MDRENVINGLEHCKIGDCVGCPYDPIREESLHGKHDKWELVCNEQLTEDILSLLKEQPEIVRCKDCKYYDHFNGCMSWHDVNSNNDNWYCADGECK